MPVDLRLPAIRDALAGHEHERAELEHVDRRAAVAAVLRGRDERTEVLVVHRPTYDDWSLPKGKLDHGESWEDAALREVHEETGVAVALGPELSRVNYTDRKGRPKTVRWWLMSSVDGHPRHRGVDREVDEARWVFVDEVRRLLSYDTDLELLDEALHVRAEADDGALTDEPPATPADVVQAAAEGPTNPAAEGPTNPAAEGPTDAEDVTDPSPAER
jgi:8-oxo-dGTP diphosphatase